MDVTARFAAWTSSLTFDLLPPDVLRAVRRLLQESIAVSVLGGDLALGRTIAAAQGVGDVPYALASEGAVSAGTAAFVNAAWADCNDSAGGAYSAPLHPAKNLIPAALSVAFRDGSSGRDVLVAIAAGTEFAFRLDIAMGLEHMARGHYSDGPIGSLASAVAVAKLRGFEPIELAKAIDISALLAPATVGGPHMWVASARPLALGQAAMVGVSAAEFASQEFAGPANALACEGGFASALGGVTDIDSLAEALGEEWQTADHYLKPYLGCKLTHPAREGLQRFKTERDLRPEDVEQIIVQHPGLDLPVIAHRALPGDSEVAFSCSSPYLMACSLLFDELGPEILRPDRMNDAAVQELSSRISIVEDPAMTAMYAPGMSARGELGTPIRMEVVLKSGTTHVYATNRVKGDPFEGCEVTDQELDEKFRTYVSGRIETGRAEECIGLLRELPVVEDIRRLGDLLS